MVGATTLPGSHRTYVGEVHIGTSGWRYPAWRGGFYPEGLPRVRELSYLSSALNSVEINGSFYGLQRPERFLAWRNATPEGFVLAVKGSRFITHMKRLRDPQRSLANFFASGVLALGDKLGPVLWQLPPSLPFDAAVLGEFLAMLPRDTAAAAKLAARHDRRLPARAYLRVDRPRPLRYALEVRHPSFVDRAAFALLRSHRVALCVADTAGRYPRIEEHTSDLVYVRLHGDVELYRSGYGDEALSGWARKVRSWRRTRDVFVYFDNDAAGRAPFDALSLARKCGVRWPHARAA